MLRYSYLQFNLSFHILFFYHHHISFIYTQRRHMTWHTAVSLTESEQNILAIHTSFFIFILENKYVILHFFLHLFPSKVLLLLSSSGIFSPFILFISSLSSFSSFKSSLFPIYSHITTTILALPFHTKFVFSFRKSQLCVCIHESAIRCVIAWKKLQGVVILLQTKSKVVSILPLILLTQKKLEEKAKKKRWEYIGEITYTNSPEKSTKGASSWISWTEQQ